MYLLDTHTLLWIAYEKQKLSKNIISILLDPNNDFFISTISIWEINIKFSLNKLHLKGQTPEELFIGFNNFFNCRYLRLEITETLSFYKLNAFHHKDPFDRMMIWQAIQHDLIFINDDENIRKYKDCGLKVLW